MKKRTTIDTSYAVVKNGDGSVIGQMVGNAKKFSFSKAAKGKILVCLDLDSNIGQDAVAYPIRDFVLVNGKSLGVPLNVNVTKLGKRYCGRVDPFLSGTFLPVLRKNVALVQPTTTTTTTSGGVGGTTSSGGVGGTTTGGTGGTTTGGTGGTTTGGTGGTTTGGAGGTTTTGGVGGTTTTVTSTTTTFTSTTATTTTTTTTSNARRPSFSITMIFLAVFLFF